jgi:hypothetical protein
MRTFSSVVGCLACAAFLISSTNTGRTQSLTTNDPQYLTFQIFTASPGFTTEAGKHVLSRLPNSTFFDDEAKQILDAVGERGDERHRLGIIVGPLALDHTDAQLRTLVRRTFAVASKYKIAVGLHIDDSKFWMNRRDLWTDHANVEWLDWSGTPNTGQYLNWGGGPWKLAPQACLNSPAMVKEARRLAGGVIGPAIAEGLANLRLTGDEALFAGVIVGWETAIGRDFDTGRDLGYCALTNLGFTANSRRRTSTARSNPWFKTGSKPGQAVWPTPACQATESTRISHLLLRASLMRTGLQAVPMHVACSIHRRRSRSARPTVRGLAPIPTATDSVKSMRR